MPNTHRRRRRYETVLSRRVGVGGVYMNSRRLPADSAMRTHNAAVGRDRVYDCRRLCSHRRHDETVANWLRIRVHTADATRLDSFVSSASAVCIGLNSSSWSSHSQGQICSHCVSTEGKDKHLFAAPMLIFYADFLFL